MTIDGVLVGVAMISAALAAGGCVAAVALQRRPPRGQQRRSTALRHWVGPLFLLALIATLFVAGLQQVAGIEMRSVYRLPGVFLFSAMALSALAWTFEVTEPRMDKWYRRRQHLPPGEPIRFKPSTVATLSGGGTYIAAVLFELALFFYLYQTDQPALVAFLRPSVTIIWLSPKPIPQAILYQAVVIAVAVVVAAAGWRWQHRRTQRGK
jgi:small-conductance mechanosensitive channel